MSYLHRPARIKDRGGLRGQFHPVGDDYTVPFAFTGTVAKVTVMRK
ncbi:MAG TPA: hypothetical protein VKZ79_07980 [Alphaproteobacteria bacterium]|nr:hypothetical protein [Alphaproteobacteria bacterium]